MANKSYGTKTEYVRDMYWELLGCQSTGNLNRNNYEHSNKDDANKKTRKLL